MPARPAPAARAARPAPRSWLFKSEPDVFSIDDLAAAEGATTCWDGVRNYQARNTLRDDVCVGDRVIFYHSSSEPPGAAGIAEVVRAGYPDPTQFDARSKYHDPDATAESPRWVSVDVRLVRKFARLVPLDEIRADPALAKMDLLRRGNRLSVQPVTDGEFRRIEALGGAATAPAPEKRAGPRGRR